MNFSKDKEQSMKEFEKLAEKVITPDFIKQLKYGGILSIITGIILYQIKLPNEISITMILLGLSFLSVVWIVKKNFIEVEE